MQWRKPANMRYTQMCQFIDAHVTEIVEAGKNKELEDTIFNYLWLLVKALAIKKKLFTNFADYDPYCFYAAGRLFFALRKNQLNQGKVIKGKLIRPIKSCLNYTKALLYPMKIEYQNETFKEVISEEVISKKFDAMNMRERLKASTAVSEGVNDLFWTYLSESLRRVGKIVDIILKKSPFQEGTLDYKHLKVSIILNCLLTIKQRKKLDTTLNTIVLWKLPKSMSTYVKVLLNELFAALKKEIIECYQEVEIDDSTLEKLISLSGIEESSHEEQS